MLGIGLLCETIGKFINCPAFVGIGTIAKAMLAPAIGAGIAYHLGGNTLIIFSAMIAASVGGNAAHVTSSCIVFVSGQPISAVIASIIAVIVGKKVTGKTRLDMMAIPFSAALICCTVQFVGFTIMSFRENEAGANIAQGLITPKVQFPNIIKNPKLVIPTFIASMVCTDSNYVISF